MDLSGLEALLVVTAISAVVPLAAAVLPGPRIAQVVLLLVGGIAIGPHGLGMDPNRQVQLISDVGVGFLFLLAGYEFAPSVLREKAGRLALVAWVISAVLAVSLVALLELVGLVQMLVPVAIALTTTALGTLLPILHDNDMLSGPIGRFVMATGAIGELFPILAIALFLGLRSEFVALLALFTIATLGGLLALLPRGLRGRALERLVLEGADTTAQATLRWTIVLLLLLLVITGEFGLDAVLGAFVAGAVLRRWVADEAGALTGKLEAVGYGFFIPVFFVYSGMSLHLASLFEAPGRLFLLLGLLFVVRAVPTLLVHRHALAPNPRIQLALCSATTLPLLVALAEIGRRNGTMLPENAAALVGAGVCSILLFPTAAIALEGRRRRAARTAE
jgi:Kef-type K+ transport system membrane component KefB